jgi:AraC-like DNA-binding protein
VPSGHDRASETHAPASETGPAGADALSDVLRAVRLTGALFFLVDASSPWVAEAPAANALVPLILPGAQHLVSYHVVITGGCWAGLPLEADTRLEAGDVVVFPHGDPYVMGSAHGARGSGASDHGLSFFKHMAESQLGSVVSEGGEGPEGTQLLCGFLGCDLLPFNPLLATLPRLVHVRPPSAPSDRLAPLVEFAVAESRTPKAGSACIRLRIAELMFVEVVRRYLAALPAEHLGWLAALRDPVVGRALALLHEQPARAWTLEELARQAAVSRSALADRFSHLVGQPPMQYLTRWRMQLAARLLSEGAAKVSAVALAVGYDSEAAFSRAFKKAVGAAPAAWRRRSQCPSSADGP